MKDTSFTFSLDKITPSEAQKEKMLHVILDQSKQEKKKTQRLTFAAITAVIVLCVAVLLPMMHSSLFLQSGSTSSEASSQVQDKTSTLGNSTGNLANGGLAAEDGSYIYYVNYFDGGSIWRAEKDGTKAMKLNSDASSYLNVKNGYIYYINNSHNSPSIYCVKTDGTENWEIYDGIASGPGPIESLILSDDALYFLSSGMIFKCESQFSADSYVIANPVEIKVKGSVHRFTLGSDGRLYYSLLEGDKEIYYALNTVTNTVEKLCEGLKTESGVNEHAGFLYYSSTEHHLQALDMNKSTPSNKQLILFTNNSPTCINAVPSNNHKIVYCAKNELRMSQQTSEGSTDIPITQKRAYNINVAGDYVFFTNVDKTATFRVKMDGSGKLEKPGAPVSSEIASNYVTMKDKTYRIAVKQTETQTPPTPEDKNFSIYESHYYGKFDLICYDTDGNQTDRIALNPLFGNKKMGFSTNFSLIANYYPRTGKADFNIGQATATNPPKGAAMGYLIFSLDQDGKLKNMPVEGGYVYSGTDDPSSTELNTNGQTELQATRTGIGQFLYNWDGTKWVLDKASPVHQNSK